MFIICPKCSAKYKIPEGIILENGQKLKCSACNFVFMKGEEEPLILEPKMKSEEPVTDSQPSVLENKTGEPNNEIPFINQEFPVVGNTSSALDEIKVDSLPEAFQPVEAPKSKKGLWLIPIYILSILALCWAGWTFRDSLKPSFKETFSHLSNLKKEASPAEKALNSIAPKPVTSTKVVVQPLDEPQKRERANKSKKINLDTIQEVKSPVPVQNTAEAEIVKPEPIKSDVTEEVASVISEKKEQPEVIDIFTEEAPSEPLNSIDTIEPDTLPLFDIVEETKPVEPLEITTKKQDLVVNNLSFRIEVNSEGLEQVLIEGEIQNTGSKAHTVPPFDVLILDKENEILNQKKIQLSTNRLEANQTAPFYTSLVPAPQEIDHIDIRFR